MVVPGSHPGKSRNWRVEQVLYSLWRVGSAMAMNVDVAKQVLLLFAGKISSAIDY